MRARHPLEFAVAALAWLLLAAAAQAAERSLKSMILMPGPLAAAHADEEQKCESCHRGFDKAGQDDLCLDCHKEVAADRASHTGFHGRSAAALATGCNGCHVDHRGRDFDIVGLDADTFDHRDTDFALQGRHAGVPCDACHRAGTRPRETATACVDCHRQDDKHHGALGGECADCHTPAAWTAARKFDHDATDFPLQGRHQSLACGACHAGEHYRFEDTSCIACHKVRDVHAGRYGTDCARCHDQEDWGKPQFDHAAATDFPLTGAHAQTPCKACHFGDKPGVRTATACLACHRSSDVHEGRHGEDCGKCHGTGDWRHTRFDHAGETGWPLLGAHRELSCLQCHQGALDAPLDTACSACHRTDDPHRSAAMEDCGACHQGASWEDSGGFDHELTQFPLEGMHAVTPCGSCHADRKFASTGGNCADCHGPDDTHAGAMGPNCHQCHTPNGWALWTFDHDKATDFPLTGAHADLSCSSCHHGAAPGDAPRVCAGCHAEDDRHAGGFGDECGRCHTTRSFGDIQWQR